MDIITPGIISSTVQLETCQCRHHRVIPTAHLVVVTDEFVTMELEGLVTELWDKSTKSEI